MKRYLIIVCLLLLSAVSFGQLRYEERVREASITTGTGSLRLTGVAPVGWRTFDTAYDDNELVPYLILGSGGSEWEIGLGHWQDDDTLDRDCVLKSNTAAKVDFSGGVKDVYTATNASSWDGPISVKLFGATGDGTTDDTAAIQAAITACVGNGDTCYFPAGTYKITSTLDVACDVEHARGATISADSAGGADPAIDVTAAGNVVRRRIWLPTVEIASRIWDATVPTVGTDVGVRISKAINCDVHASVKEFSIGIQIVGLGFNQLHNPHAEDCAIGIQIKPADEPGYANQWSVFGGRMAQSLGSGVVVGTRNFEILEPDDDVNVPNNICVFGTSFEGSHPEYHLKSAGTDCVFTGIRWESTAPKVYWTDQAMRNTIIGGYDVSDIVVTEDADAATENTLIMSQGLGIGRQRTSTYALDVKQDQRLFVRFQSTTGTNETRVEHILDRTDDVRGAGYKIQSSAGSEEEWFAGVPYLGGGYSLGLAAGAVDSHEWAASRVRIETTGVVGFADEYEIFSQAEGRTASLGTTIGRELVTLSGATTDTTINVPSGALLRGVQFCVNTASDRVWDAAFIGGSTTSLATGASNAKNTKVNTLIVPEVASAQTNIQFTPTGGDFTGGVIEVLIYYDYLTSMGDS